MDKKKFSIVCPLLYNTGTGGKVAVIKAIRTLTGMGLKEAKDASEVTERRAYEINGRIYTEYSDPERVIEEQFRIMRVNGVDVGGPVEHILTDLRKLAEQALAQHEDELANEILQLVLAEKLRRKFT